MNTMAFGAIRLPDGSLKPRSNGLTSILDKGHGPGAASDLVTTAGEWIDVVKMGWGTPRVQPSAVVREKLAMYRDAGIDTCTGGTLLEVAYAQDRVGDFLDEARHLGFTMIEVSNGVHPMTQDEKLELIGRALTAGFSVWSEVGRKDPGEDARIPVADRLAAVESELASGASKVVLEARESGSVGIYDARGEPAQELIERIVERVGVANLVFEAPRKPQQVWMIRHFGPQVNLGNIAPNEAIGLATLRAGLRGDTVPDVHLGGTPVYVAVGLNGAMEASDRGGVVVLVDALRASATIVTALATGMKSVRPVLTLADCKGDVTAGERGGRKLPELDHGNSPSELIQAGYQGRSLVLTTSNGTECLLAADGPASVVLVGSALNASAVARAALALAEERGSPITLLTAGRNNRQCVEDELVASEICHAMGSATRLTGPPLATSAALDADFFASDSGQNLVQLGYADDVHLCAQLDRFDVVPVFRDGLLVPLQDSH